MHRAVRKWADIQREGQTQPTGNWEKVHELNEQESKKEKREKAKAKAKAEREAAASSSIDTS